MNGTRTTGLALLFATAAYSITPFISHAANEPVFMMQLGSFESEEAAQAHWGEIKGKYPNILGNIEAQVRPVSLPPDDLVAYRTQAGPVTTRGTAERLCAQITNAGDECFVVETAMVALPNAPLPSAPVEPLQQMAETISEAPSDVPAFLSELPAPDLPSPDLPEDPASMALEEMPNVPELPDVPAPVVNVETPAIEPKRESRPRTLFGELFGDESEALFDNEEAAPAPVAQTRALPAPPAIMDEISPEVELIEPVQPADALANIRLPAPPPPEAITRGETVATPAEPAPVQPAAVVPAPQAPVAPEPVVANIPFKRAQPAATPQPVPAPAMTDENAGGQVAVAEAIPVPLSEQKQPRVVMQPQQAYSAQEIAARGLPSQALQQRTFWAQISQFDSQQNALGFWESFRRNNPGFPAMRVRVTQPYAQSRLGNPNVSLRVGPFDGPGMVGALCKALPSNDIRCGVVADLGTSTAANQSRNRLPESRYGSRYAAASSSRPGVPGYWVQLGAFGSPGQAEFAWTDLQEQVPALLGSLRSDITTPSLSSSSQTSFRLRTGPYMRVASATQLCGQLKQRGVRCLVVSGN